MKLRWWWWHTKSDSAHSACQHNSTATISTPIKNVEISIINSRIFIYSNNVTNRTVLIVHPLFYSPLSLSTAIMFHLMLLQIGVFFSHTKCCDVQILENYDAAKGCAFLSLFSLGVHLRNPSATSSPHPLCLNVIICAHLFIPKSVYELPTKWEVN